MHETGPTPTYRNYLLTVWQQPNHTPTNDLAWRFLLADPHSGKRYGFTTADDLLLALHELSPEMPDLEQSP